MEAIHRFPTGDRKYPSQIELEKQGWIRGDYRDRPCERCGQICEWWGLRGKEDWTLFNWHITQLHAETCKPK
jgi:hypothetical protein